ncbi:Y-family DNA polymerase [Acuticoccus kandeliae]|uniref:Y-family DNA polymerase n=1 Tax=Acuticoccus kandeliae TaxID=2073160 RepID=UPI0013009D87|nr:DNA polymerase Y family protein [Acuticoccus kandeliae]
MKRVGDQRPSRRVLHLWMPFLATDRLARERGEVRSGPGGAKPPPWATVMKVNGALVLDAVDRVAKEAGLSAGLSLAEARAQIPSLRVEAADPEADRALLLSIARAADRYTPFVGLDAPQGLFLDISGCAHLFGGERGLLRDILVRLRAWGVEARAAIGDNPTIAWAVARYGEGGIVPPGAEQAVLDPLPIEALRIPAETVAVLRRLGLKSVLQLRSQPRRPLVHRFGPLLAMRMEQAEGRQGEPITPLSQPPRFVVERAFAEPLMQIEAVIGTLEKLAIQLSEALEAKGEGARRLRLRLFHANGMVHDVVVGASMPLCAAARMVRLLCPRLERLSERIENESGIDLIRLAGEETALLEARQADLDGSEALSDLARLIDTLTERLGEDAVRRFVRADTHQPGEAAAWRPAATTVREVTWPEPAQGAFDRREEAIGRAGVPALERPPGRPIRLFDPPEPVETLASVPDGPPIRFVWRRVPYRVAAAEGPERIAAKWWQGGNGETCDYFRVEDEAGRRFWMFRRGLYGDGAPRPQWFMHGLFA